MDDIYEKKTLIDNGVDISKNYKLINKSINIEIENAKKVRDILKKKLTKKSKTTEDEFNENLENFLNNDKISDETLLEYKALIENINYLKDKYMNDKNKIRLISTNGTKIKLKKIN